ncbi:MAG: hypothetical protein JWO31_3775 [Phycisphaerales bacterium]|nr:hypothetical protein [Phycisphaerales bacterium]
MTPNDQSNLTAYVASIDSRDLRWARLGKAVLLSALKADPSALPPAVRATVEAFQAAAAKEGVARA